MSNLKELKRLFKLEQLVCNRLCCADVKESPMVKYVKALEKENRELKKAIKVAKPMTEIGVAVYNKDRELAETMKRIYEEELKECNE